MSILRPTLAAVCMACLFTFLGSYSGAQVADGNWVTYNRTLAGDRFSPLKEINRSNVAKLKAICMYTLSEVSSLQTGPLVIDGTMYFTTDEGSYAIDASTCAEKWKQHRHSDTPSMLLVNRGFAYANGRLFRGTSDSHVLAMDPADGENSLAIGRRTVYRRWHCDLSCRRTTAHRSRVRNEVTGVAGRRSAEPHSRVRFALTKVNDASLWPVLVFGQSKQKIVSGAVDA